MPFKFSLVLLLVCCLILRNHHVLHHSLMLRGVQIIQNVVEQVHWQPGDSYNSEDFDKENFCHVRDIEVLAHEQDAEEVYRNGGYLQHYHGEV
jgi:hypothetical protein